MFGWGRLLKGVWGGWNSLSSTHIPIIKNYTSHGPRALNLNKSISASQKYLPVINIGH